VNVDLPPRSRTQERPAPDWEVVLRRNSIERLKRDRPPLQARAELPDLIARGYEDVPEADLVRLHWWGLAHDKPKVGTFMVRIKVPGGILQPAQVRGLGRVSEEYAAGAAELTTRQGVQLHQVPMARLPDVLTAVEALGLTTAGAEGDTVRNVTGCPLTGLSASEPFDVTPLLREVAAFFSGNPDFSNLPRKHKYTISACPAQCSAPEIHDVALVGTVVAGEPGFGVRVGGGLSNTPRISRDLGVFVPVDDALEVLQAITNVWQQDLRYRLSRAKSRIKFLVDDHGPAGVRARVEAELGRQLAHGAAPMASGEQDHLGVTPQRQRGLVSVGVPVPSGRVTAPMLTGLADLAGELGADLRLTRQQNVILGSVPVRRLARVTAGLAALGLPTERGRAYGRSVACTSHRFCNYSVAETKDKLDTILRRLTDRFGAAGLGGLAIHIDGCPHACAQHWVGEIGLQGTTTHLPDGGGRVEAYDLSVGGGLGPRTGIGRRLVRRVPTGEVDAVLERLVGAWLAAREAGQSTTSYSFADFCAERTEDELLAVATGTPTGTPTAGTTAGTRAEGTSTAVADRAVRVVVVHLPGPLLCLVDGADRLEVAAGTVGEALAAVAREHPAFGAAVLPHGAVARAYLVAVDDEDIRDLQGLATPVGPGTAIRIVMAMAGG